MNSCVKTEVVEITSANTKQQNLKNKLLLKRGRLLLKIIYLDNLDNYYERFVTGRAFQVKGVCEEYNF